MLTCYRCGAAAVGPTGTCANCGAQAFASPYAMPMGMLPGRRRVKGLGLSMVILLGVNALADLLLAVAMHRRDTLVARLLDYQSGDRPGLDEVRSSDRFVGGSFLFFVVTLIACGVVMICWFYAARTNAETYGPDRLMLPRGWAIGCWFIPLADIVLPLLVALDIHRGTDSGRGKQPSGGVITWFWWITYIVSNVMFLNALGKRGDNDFDLEAMQSQARAMQPALIVMLVAAVLCAVYVYKISKIQTARAVESPGGMPPGFAAPYGQPGYGQPGFAPAGHGQPAMGMPQQYAPPAPTAWGQPAPTAYGPGQGSPYVAVTEPAEPPVADQPMAPPQ